MYDLPDYNKITFPENPPIPFEKILPDASPEAIDLLKRFLVYPSKQRIPATEVIHIFLTVSFSQDTFCFIYSNILKSVTSLIFSPIIRP